MGNRVSLPGLMLLGAGTALVALTPAAATGAPATPPPPHDMSVVGHQVPRGAALTARILRYWTQERMLRAMEPPAPPGGERAARSRPPSSATSAGAPWAGGGLIARTSGKVFFTLGGRDYLCSATAVAAANRDTVVTAGHCAKNGTGAWARNWIFVPGYREGTSPYGGYPARRLFVTEQWARDGDGDYDVAMVAVSRSGGRHLTDAVGGHAIAFGRPRGRQTYMFGYPATGRYDGERLAYCSGRPHADPYGGTTGQGMRCDMTEGASGGGWLTDFDPRTGTGVLTSVSSFKFADDETTMYAPYFGPAIKRLYARAQRA